MRLHKIWIDLFLTQRDVQYATSKKYAGFTSVPYVMIIYVYNQTVKLTFLLHLTRIPDRIMFQTH